MLLHDVPLVNYIGGLFYINVVGYAHGWAFGGSGIFGMSIR